MMKIALLWIFVFCCSGLLVSQNWESVGGGASRHVRALYGDTTTNILYLGGSFVYADTLRVNGVAGWDGNQYFSLADGSSSCTHLQCPHGFTNAIKYRDDIYFAYFMGYLGGVLVKGIAKWDGTS